MPPGLVSGSASAGERDQQGELDGSGERRGRGRTCSLLNQSRTVLELHAPERRCLLDRREHSEQPPSCEAHQGWRGASARSRPFLELRVRASRRLAS